MESSTLLPAQFAVHLFALTTAVAAATVLGRRTGRPFASRAAGALGFLVLAAAQAAHGAGFAAETELWAGAARTSGYALVLLSALVAPGAGLAALVAPAAVMPPAVAALAAGVAMSWRARRERGRMAMAAGLVLMGAFESVLAVPRASFSGATVTAHLLLTLGWGGVAAGVVSATRRSIRFKMVAGFVAVLLVVILAVSAALTSVIAGNLRREAAERVGNETGAIREEIEPLAQGQVGNVVAIAGGLDLGQPSRVLNDQLDALLTRIFRELDFIAVLDRAGLVRARAGVDEVEALQLAGTDEVRSALDGTEAVSLDTLGTELLAIVGAAPVADLDRPGRQVGVVVVGRRLDGDLLRLLARATPSAVVDARAGALVAETLPVFEAGDGLPRDLARRIATRVIERGEELRDTATIGSREYFLAVLPLQRQVGRVIGALLGAEPSQVLAAAERGVNRVLFLVALGAVAVALMLSALFARRLSGPVRSLTAAARRVREGDLAATAPVRGEDEVGDLAIAFNEMTESLGRMTHSLRDAAEEETRLREELETVLNSMGDGLIAVDPDDRVVTFNPAAERITGLPVPQAMGRPVGEILVGRTKDGRALPRGGPLAAVALLRRANGETPVAIASSPIQGEGGETIGRVYVIRDRSREAEVERIKREFLATVSHELRTPLTPIVGYAELMLGRDTPPERVGDFARGILESAHRLERIVGMLVDYSAIEAGRMVVEPEPTALKPIVGRAVDEWRARAPGHRFVTRFEPAVPDALVDVLLFRRMIDELLDNAVKYSPQGGRVAVSLESAAAGNGRPPGGRGGRPGVLVRVSDTGIGIDAKDLPGIFQDFRQLDGSDTRAYGGLGLGLAFVNRIVQAHRGSIEADSRPGEGTMITIHLPAAEAGTSPVPIAQGKRDARKANRKGSRA